MARQARHAALVSSILLALAAAACGTDGDGTELPSGAGGNGGSSGQGNGGDSSGQGAGSSGSLVTSSTGVGGEGGGTFVGDPKTCDQAAQAKTYIGCDFWPTVTANQVWSIFDYAVVVANAGDEPASVTVERGGVPLANVTIPANALEKIYLPWVPELKGPDFGVCTEVIANNASVRVPGGAYHLVSSIPVTVYQFSALEYGPQGGPPGKDWSSCPASACGLDCFSYSNDASLLLPSTALTPNYRVVSYPSWPLAGMASYVTITGLEDATTVTISFGPLGGSSPGADIPAATNGQVINFPISRGEVVQVFGSMPGDLSGSLIQGDKPIQVLHGHPCRFVPDDLGACDHIEESILPAETLGEHYFVVRPTGSNGGPVGQVVRLVGNVNNTTLTYPAGMPANAPTTLNAGQVVDLGIVQQDFEVIGSNEFAVATFQLGADALGGALGDPAASAASGVEQYRTKYIFLAPGDYSANFVDIVMPMTAIITLDGAPLPVAPQPLSSGFGIARVPLALGNNGAHVLVGTEPFGIQVMGYGSYTSYQYPGGLNLDVIAPPPPPPPPPN